MHRASNRLYTINEVMKNTQPLSKNVTWEIVSHCCKKETNWRRAAEDTEYIHTQDNENQVETIKATKTNDAAYILSSVHTLNRC